MKYKLGVRANPQDREAMSRHYGVPAYLGERDLQRISHSIADKSSLALGGVYNVQINFVEDLPEYMSDKFKVSPNDFGIFKALFGSEGVDDPFAAKSVVSYQKGCKKQIEQYAVRT